MDGGIRDGKGYYYYVEGTETENRIQTQTYTSGTFIKDDNTETTASSQSPIIMRQTYYGYKGLGYIANPYYNLIFRQSTNTSVSKQDFWLAAHLVDLRPQYCYYNVRGVKSGSISGNALYCSSEWSNSLSCAVVPMVTLQSNIQVSGMDANGVWILDTSTN